MLDYRDALAVTTVSGLVGALFFFVPLWGPQLVFRQLTPKEKVVCPHGLPHFSLSDALVLMTFLAAANALVALLPRETHSYEILGLAICANFLVVLLWVKCLRFMEQNTIVEPRSRLLLQSLLYPASVFVAAEMLMTAIMLLSLLEVFADGLTRGVAKYVTHPFTLAAATTFACSAIAVVVIRRLFKRFVMLGPIR